MADGTMITDGSCSWDSGVDSLKTPTVASPLNPNGLTRSQLHWLINATVRDGSISPRDGWANRGVVVGPGSLPSLLGQPFQGEFTYAPSTGNPYKICVIGGHVIKVDPTFATAPIDLSAIYGLTFPAPLADKCYFEQANSFLIIQSGDYNPQTGLGTLPLFWNGTTLSQSNGLTGITEDWLQPVQYGFTPLNSAFVVPAVNSTVQFPINAAYMGLLSANLQLYSQAANTQELVGVFQVTATTIIAGINYITVKTISLSGSARGMAGAVIVTPCVLESYYQSGGNSISYSNNTTSAWGQVTTANPSVVPPAGSTGTITFDGSGNPPTSGDIYTIYDSYLTPVAVVQVTNVTGQVVSVTYIFTATDTESLIGQVIQGQPNVVPSQNVPFTPVVGSSFTLVTSGRYGGAVNDIVFLNGTTMVSPNLMKNFQLGTYQVTTINADSIVLEALQNSTPGQPVLYDAINPYTITSNSYVTNGSGLLSQIPAATAMKYYMNRLWYMNGQTVSAGDISGGDAGTLATNYTDSVLSVTENPLSVGGDGFTMPAGNDQLTGFGVPQMINASLGEGLLNIGSPNWLFSLYVPVTRADWIAADQNNQPQINVVQSGTGTGPVNDETILPINGDLWYFSSDNSIRSALTAVRYFQQWGGVILSSNEERILSLNNVALMDKTNSAYFSNRAQFLIYPQTSPVGTYYPAIVPLDLTTISTLETQDPPNWEGHYEGLNMLSLKTMTFGRVGRCFGLVLSNTVTNQIECWEQVIGSTTDDGSPIKWQATFPSFHWDKLFELKELQALELWIDKLLGLATIQVEYQPDGSGVWYQWALFNVCSATDNTQLPNNTNPYPTTYFKSGVRKPLVLPQPPDASAGSTGRPARVAYEFQIRITVTGQLRIRGIILDATLKKKSLYDDLIKTINQWKTALAGFIFPT